MKTQRSIISVKPFVDRKIKYYITREWYTRSLERDKWSPITFTYKYVLIQTLTNFMEISVNGF